MKINSQRNNFNIFIFILFLSSHIFFPNWNTSSLVSFLTSCLKFAKKKVLKSWNYFSFCTSFNIVSTRLHSAVRKFGAWLFGSCKACEYNFFAQSAFSVLALAFAFEVVEEEDEDVEDEVPEPEMNLLSPSRFCWQRWTKSKRSFSVSGPSSPAVAIELLFDS